MTDQPDRQAQPDEDIPMADPPAGPTGQATLTTVIQDINDLANQFNDKAMEVTPEFIEGVTREIQYFERL